MKRKTYEDLFDHLVEKCNFHEKVKGDPETTRWTCYCDLRFVKQFCEKYNIHFDAVKHRLNRTGGYCDCEILFNSIEKISKNEELPEQMMCIVCENQIKLGDSVYPGMNECWHRWCGSGTNGAVMREKGLIWHKNGNKVSK